MSRTTEDPSTPRFDGDEIIVAGDVHLGAAKSDVAAFEAFLAALEGRAFDRLVLLGDVWDLVRRDPFGCAWETTDTIARLKRLAEGHPVHALIGNHDEHLTHLDAARYEVDFRESLVLQSGRERIRFCHGDEFDRFQSDVVSTYLSGPGDRGEIDPTGGRKDPVVAWARAAIQRGKERIGTGYRADGGGEARPAFPRRERRAHASLASIDESKLIYGHTHAPYVHPDNTVANPGSWTTTAPLADTYLVVDDGEIALYQFREGQPDVRLHSGAPGGS